MCIVVLTTTHPDYALIVINNRDEYIRRPTSRPHWWTLSAEVAAVSSCDAGNVTPEAQILSSRDLNRPERGTWLGITRSGNFACLTNYSEADPNDARHSIHGVRSRGAIVSAWLAAHPAEDTPQFVRRILDGPGLKGVGGFSLVCGKLRRRHRRHPSSSSSNSSQNHHNHNHCPHPNCNSSSSSSSSPPYSSSNPSPPPHTTRSIQPLAVISNRSQHPEHVPYIAASPGETHGLSNTAFDAEGPPWPKVSRGCHLLERAVRSSYASSSSSTAAEKEDHLVSSLFAVLSTDDLPRLPRLPVADFDAYMPLLRSSIFIPPLGRDQSWLLDPAAAPSPPAAPAAAVVQQPSPPQDPVGAGDDDDAIVIAPMHAGGGAPSQLPRHHHHHVHKESASDPAFTMGQYGTQRQTVILVDWDGNVRYTERALWDQDGNPLSPGEGDVTFRFRIEGWDDEDDDNETEPENDGNGHCRQGELHHQSKATRHHDHSSYLASAMATA